MSASLETTLQRPHQRISKRIIDRNVLGYHYKRKKQQEEDFDLMQKLSNEYGVSKPFNDNELFARL
jgi:hypothetical protein